MKNFTFLLLFFTSLTYAQKPKKEMALSEIFREAISTDTQDPLIIKNKIITNDWTHSQDSSYKTPLKSILNDLAPEFDNNGYLVINREILIEDSDIIGVSIDSILFNKKIRLFNIRLLGWLNFTFCSIDELVLDNVTTETVSTYINIKDSEIRHSQLNGLDIHGIRVENSELGNLFMYLDELNSMSVLKTLIKNLSVYNSNISSFNLTKSKIYSDEELANIQMKYTSGGEIQFFHSTLVNSGFNLENCQFDLIKIENCEFGESNPHSVALIDLVQSKSFTLKGNKYYSSANFKQCDFTDQIYIEGNDFQKGVSLSGINLYDRFMSIKWSDVNDKLILYHGDSVISFNNAYQSEDDYLNLSRTVYHIYSSFKNNGNLVDANRSYKWLRDFEGKRLGYLYNQHGGFDNFLRWRLNTIMRIYTEQGTSPTKAISISAYIILAFAIFYFFFPSEWDITSKSKLIKDFKDFTQKNDKGYIRPFLSMLLGIIISLINALTLSLNAFTTLGFGRIPAKGLAKYVCVIQGFIGWFLLSIFTVALINQVLA